MGSNKHKRNLSAESHNDNSNSSIRVCGEQQPSCTTNCEFPNVTKENLTHLKTMKLSKIPGRDYFFFTF